MISSAFVTRSSLAELAEYCSTLMVWSIAMLMVNGLVLVGIIVCALSVIAGIEPLEYFSIKLAHLRRWKAQKLKKLRACILHWYHLVNPLPYHATTKNTLPFGSR